MSCLNFNLVLLVRNVWWVCTSILTHIYSLRKKWIVRWKNLTLILLNCSCHIQFVCVLVSCGYFSDYMVTTLMIGSGELIPNSAGWPIPWFGTWLNVSHHKWRQFQFFKWRCSTITLSYCKPLPCFWGDPTSKALTHSGTVSLSYS